MATVKEPLRPIAEDIQAFGGPTGWVMRLGIDHPPRFSQWMLQLYIVKDDKPPTRRTGGSLIFVPASAFPDGLRDGDYQGYFWTTENDTPNRNMTIRGTGGPVTKIEIFHAGSNGRIIEVPTAELLEVFQRMIERF